MKKGILLIATTHHNYGGMAYNLAMTLKAAEPDIKVALVHDKEGIRYLTEDNLSIFDERIEKDLHGLQLKLELPNITPFEKTMYIDVDTLWLSQRKPSDLMALLDSVPFSVQNEGYLDLETDESTLSGVYMYWGDKDAIKAAYNLKGKFWQFRSEVILFDNTKEVKAMFALARKLSRKPKTEVVSFAGTYPDEYFLNIAANISGMEPHEVKWQPGYWAAKHGGIVPLQRDISSRYYFISFGGNTSNKRLKKLYEEVLQGASNKTGLYSAWRLQSKSNYLTERRKY